MKAERATLSVISLALGAVHCASAAAVTPAPLVVQSHVVAERCLGRAPITGPVRVDLAASLNPEGADIVVAPDEILGRFLESGALVESTAVELGSVPWVLVGEGAPPVWTDLERLQPEVWVLGGSAGSAARKALQRIDPARIHSTTDLAQLDAARLALVPASLATRRTAVPAPVEPLRLRAVLTKRGSGSPPAQAALRTIADDVRLRQCVTGR